MGGGVSWRLVNATVTGTSHVRGQLPCQDDCIVDVVSRDSGEILIAVVSDGAGSSTCAEEGAGLACESMYAAVEEWLSAGGTISALEGDVVNEWVRLIRAAIESRASEKDLTPRDFACTLVAAVVDERAAAFLQVGDGAIVVGNDEIYEVVFWPDAGEYANMTFFVTDDDWATHLHFQTRAAAFEDVALMTDGLQRLALHYDTRTAHAPFFLPMFTALENRAAGYAMDLEPALVSFLASDVVNARTDDDKSLVLATRRRAGAGHGTL
jgi:hypothetical protein